MNLTHKPRAPKAATGIRYQILEWARAYHADTELVPTAGQISIKFGVSMRYAKLVRCEVRAELVGE